jgi:hypothetical protein
MGDLGLQRAVRDRRFRTTVPADMADLSTDLVQRDFTADWPIQISISDFTYVTTWRRFLCVAFVDVFSHRMVGWRVGSAALRRPSSLWMP